MSHSEDVPPIHMINLQPEIQELRAELLQAFDRVLDSGSFIMGQELRAFEEEVADYLGVKHAVGLNSGTDALVIGLRALGIGPGDEVITSPFTFFATAEAIALVGATPVFVDIEYDSFNLDPGLLETAITSRTRAIMPVHLYGRTARMDRLLAIAHDLGLFVVEDAAQAFGARAYDLPQTPFAGTIGQVGAFSFYPTKNLGAYGDAGMLTTNDDDLALEARKLRSHGSLRAYSNEVLGYNSRLDELQAAILRTKLPHVERWNEQRRQLAEAYREALLDVPGLEWPEVVPGHVFHQITVRVKSDRDAFLASLHRSGVMANVYYPKLASQLGGMGWSQGHTPVALQAAQEVVSLPILPAGPASDDFCRVASTIRSAVQQP